PGYVDTPMTDATISSIVERTGRSRAEALTLLERRQPIGRLVEPGEVAQAVAFCLDNAAVTGQGINVDGGAVQS
ncbi:MAG: SDR family oxidoreductase, partial [Actinomycetes bacterium]